MQSSNIKIRSHEGWIPKTIDKETKHLNGNKIKREIYLEIASESWHWHFVFPYEDSIV